MATTIEAASESVPVLSFTASVPGESELSRAGPDAPLFLKFAETAYHRHSPYPSRRSGSPNVRQGRRPIAVTPSAPQGLSAEPSSSVSGQGRTPGLLGSLAA